MKSEKSLLEAWHIEAIKRRIDEILRIRCFNVTTKLELDTKEKTRLRLTSTSFNTVPVIHSAMALTEFNSSVTEGVHKFEDGTETPCTNFYINVAVRYEGNGESLFEVKGMLLPVHENRIFFTDGNIRNESVSKWDIEKV